MREDFPTFDRPAKAISGSPGGGYWEGFTALMTNSADRTIMDSHGRDSSAFLVGSAHPTGFSVNPFARLARLARFKTGQTGQPDGHFRHFHF